MERIRLLARRHGFDVLIVIAALESAIEAAIENDRLRNPQTASWFAAPAIALMVLVLLGRRRFPFAAPASVWLLGAALSFVDGRLVAQTAGAFLAGMAASFLLGNLRDEREGRLGLAVVLGGALIVAYNDPHRATGDLIFIPGLFALLWVAGFALRERAARAEAAEERAQNAEQERESAARLAVRRGAGTNRARAARHRRPRRQCHGAPSRRRAT
jgi:hypothetical protein